MACGTWDVGSGYPRTRSLLAGLRHAGCAVAECRAEPAAGGSAKRRVLRTPAAWPALAWRLARSRRRLRAAAKRAIAEFAPDVLLVPYPGHLAAPWLRDLFAGPLVLDLFLSAHDTAVQDRELFRPQSLLAKLLLAIDCRASRAADLVLLDTAPHAAAVAELLGRGGGVSWVQVGDPDAAVDPPPYRAPGQGEPLELLFLGTGVPLHGLDVLIAAVERVAAVRLTLVGGSAAERAAASDRLGSRLRLEPEFVPPAVWRRHLSRCHLAAGIFSDRPKAQRVVPFKVVHALAAGRPVLTADTPAIRGLLAAGEECAVCAPGDVEAVAASLAALAAAPSALVRLAGRARPAFERSFSTAAVGQRLRAELAAAWAGHRSPVGAGRCAATGHQLQGAARASRCPS